MRHLFKKAIHKYPNLPRMSKNSFWLAADSLIRFSINFFIMAWMARYLGPIAFGAFNYAVAISFFIVFTGGMGLNEIVIKRLIANPKDSDAILGTVFILRLTAALLVFAGCLSFIMWQEKDPEILSMTAILCAGTLFQVFDVIDVFFQSGLRSRLTVVAKSSAFFLISLLKVLAIIHHQPVVVFAWLGAIEIFLGALSLVIMYSFQRGVSSLHYDHHIFLNLCHCGWPMAIASILAVIYFRIDLFFIRSFWGDTQLGLYSCATRITEMMAVIAPLIYVSAFPVIISSREQGDETAYRHNLRSLISFIFILCCTIALLISCFAPSLIKIFYGPSFTASADILRIHIWGLPFLSLGGITAYALVVEGATIFHCLRTFAAFVFNIFAMFLFVPLCGPKGAAWVVVITFAIPTIVLFLNKEFRNRWLTF